MAIQVVKNSRGQITGYKDTTTGRTYPTQAAAQSAINAAAKAAADAAAKARAAAQAKAAADARAAQQRAQQAAAAKAAADAAAARARAAAAAHPITNPAAHQAAPAQPPVVGGTRLALPTVTNAQAPRLPSGGKGQEAQVKTETGTTSTSETQNTNVKEQQQTNQQQQEQAQKNSWLLAMPGLSSIVQRSITEASKLQTPQYQLAGLNTQEQAALNTLMQNRDQSQMQGILGAYQQQAGQLTSYAGTQQKVLQGLQQQQSQYDAQQRQQIGAYQNFAQNAQNYAGQQSQINQLAQGYYQSDLVNQQKTQLAQDINNQLAGGIRTLNQQAIGSGNMASSRAGVTEGVMRGKAMESIAKGEADIENNARQSAYNMAYSQYGTGQQNVYNALGAQTQIGQAGNALNLQNYAAQQGIAEFGQNAYSQNLGQQSQLAQVLANWGQTDAQTRYNAARIMQQQSQQQMDINRQNQLLSGTQGLQALTAYLPAWSSLASMGQTSTGTSTTGTTSNTGSQTGVTGSQTVQQAGQTGMQGVASGDTGINWGELGSGLLGQAGGSMLQPVGSALGSGIVSGVQGIGHAIAKLWS